MSVVTISSFGFTGFRLDDLQRQVTRIQAFALSDNTKRNYRSVWNTYSKFCQFYSITPFPASASTVAAFIVLLSFSVKSHHTINNYLSALRRLHVFCHFDTSGFDDIHVKLTQKGLEKSMVHLPHRKAPLTPGILLQFYRNLDIRDSAHLALWCAILVGFFSFFRTANLVPRSLDSSSPHQVLSRGSITFTSSATLITVTRTKTRQAGDTALVVPVPYITGSPLCPTAALQSLFIAVSAPDSSPLFTFTTPSGQLDCITATSLNNGIKHLVSMLSLDPADFSGHSLRRGGATFAFQCGIPSELIKLQGDWRSDAYMLYLTLPLADRLVLSQLIKQHIQSL